MSRHTTYRGTTVDMDALRRENEKVPALGNMRTNARGDQLGKNGVVTKTADQIARDNHRVQSVVVSTGLKGKQPDSKDLGLDASRSVKPVQQVEKELPSGDIIIEEDKK